MFARLFLLLIILCFVPTGGSAQSEGITMGFGTGLDYGGIGLNLSVFPHKNIGIFGAAGYAFAGFGTNVGLKLRTGFDKSTSSFRFFLTGMYGYQTAVAVIKAKEHNKLFYGATIGGGMDLRFFKQSNDHLSFSILIPFRNTDYQVYMDGLTNIYGIEFKTKPSPVNISIGYHIHL
jgi:hypothetical protein